MKGLFDRLRKTRKRPQNKPLQLLVEALEDRTLMAAVAGGADFDKRLFISSGSAGSAGQIAAPLTTSRGALGSILPDDAYEQNDSFYAARSLGAVGGPTSINNLVMADGNDWYRFTTAAKPGANDSVSIGFQNSLGNVDLALYNSVGQRLRYSAGTGNGEQVSLSGLAAGTYYARVYGFLGATNPSYSLSINVASAVADDGYENNDTFGAASNLGTLTSARTISNLVMADGHDWYRFTMGGAGTSTDFVAASFQNSQGNLDLELYNSSGTRLAVSSTLSNAERISLAGRASGTYYVHVYGVGGARNPSYALQIDPGVAASTPPPSTGAFNIQFRFSGLTSSQQTIFQQAAAKWQSVITGDLPSAAYNGVAVDDLLIDASGAYIDGTGNILGQAGPDAVRAGTYLPYHGTMQFDTADLASMQANGTLLGVIEHEMGHVLGIGTIWSNRGLLVGAGTSNPMFVGAQATAAYNSIFGKSASGVPVENSGGSGTRDSHWRESIFGNELMTGWVGPGSNMPLSRITVGSLADLGYTVNYTAADSFTPSIASSASLAAATTSTSSTARLTSNVAPAALPLHERVLDGLLAAWDRLAHQDSVDTAFAVPSRHSHEAAVDALLAKWSLLSALG